MFTLSVIEQEELKREVAAYNRGWDDALRMVNKQQKVPRCPKCGSPKLQCPNGHAWDIE